jgi:hypothetical protein
LEFLGNLDARQITVSGDCSNCQGFESQRLNVYEHQGICHPHECHMCAVLCMVLLQEKGLSLVQMRTILVMLNIMLL